MEGDPEKASSQVRKDAQSGPTKARIREGASGSRRDEIVSWRRNRPQRQMALSPLVAQCGGRQPPSRPSKLFHQPMRPAEMWPRPQWANCGPPEGQTQPSCACGPQARDGERDPGREELLLAGSWLVLGVASGNRTHTFEAVKGPLTGLPSPPRVSL